MEQNSCTECGQELSTSAKFCPSCGARVGQSPSTTSPVMCKVCGHENLHSDAYCESCGARLPGRSVQHSRSTDEKPSSKPTSKKSRTPNKNGQPLKFEVWHYAIGVLLLALVGLFIYMETQRTHSPSATQPQQSMPMQSGMSGPSQELLDAIHQLEHTVKENPNDVVSRLKYANALHDAGTHDISYMPRAIEEYNTYLKSQPSDPNARVDLGICYFELGKTDSLKSAELFALAVREMESALKTSPKHQAGAFNLGIVQLYSGNFVESNKWFKKATELNPESELGKRAKSILEQHSQQM